jgi:hypothetical protein
MNVRWQDHSRTIAECRAMLAASERLLRETWPDTFLGRQALIVPENEDGAIIYVTEREDKAT